MKNRITISFIVIFIFGLIPFNFSYAISQDKISAEVQIVCTDGTDNWFSGSGTIIDPKGIILTNRHVVEGAYKNTCFIGFLESINQEPNFGSKGNPNLAEVKYITTTKDTDAAVLYLNNPTNKIYSYINIWNFNSDSLKFGDKLEVVGFPSVGGSTITYTSGDFSGFGSQSDGTKNYIKTTVPLEHGNSGGSAYTLTGQFVGIPTFVIKGSLNSVSYILSVNSIRNWLSGILGSDYKEKVIIQEPIIVKPIRGTQSDITPPDIYKILLNKIGYDWKASNSCNNCGIYIGADTYSSEKIYGYSDPTFGFYIEDFLKFSPDTKNIYMYFGTDINANPAKGSGDGYRYWSIIPGMQYLNYELKDYGGLKEKNIYYFVIQAVDNNNNYSDKLRWRYNYDPSVISNKIFPDSFSIYLDGIGKKLIFKVDAGISDQKIINISNKNFFVEWSYKGEIPSEIKSYQVNLTSENNEYNEESFTSQNFAEFKGIYDNVNTYGKKDIRTLKEGVIYNFNLSVRTASHRKDITPFKIKFAADEEKNSTHGKITSGELVKPVTPVKIIDVPKVTEQPKPAQKTPKVIEKAQPSKPQRESVVIESSDTKGNASTPQQNTVVPEKEQKKKASLPKRFFSWVANWF